MLTLNFNPFPVIPTERLFLRKVEKTDVEQIYFLRSDERVMKYLDKAPAQSLEEALLFIEKILNLEKDNEAVTWGIRLKNNPGLIGTICFWNINKEHYRVELGYVLHPQYRFTRAITTAAE